MLRSHMNAIEAILLAQSTVASNAGHPNLRGGPREWFIRDFLSAHLPGTLEIGQGEIIDALSPPSPRPGDYRPQVDIVLYRRNLPKITYARDTCAFLAEGAMATIEVKSVLTQEAVKTACQASLTHKRLQRGIPMHAMGGGWRPQHIVSYLVAFDSRASIATVAGWLTQTSLLLNAAPNLLPEMLVVLGKGLVWRIDTFPDVPIQTATAGHTWAYVQQCDQNLFTFFVHMLSWMGWATSPPNLMEYTQSLALPNIDCL